jgi:hypothetical protein
MAKGGIFVTFNGRFIPLALGQKSANIDMKNAYL